MICGQAFWDGCLRVRLSGTRLMEVAGTQSTPLRKGESSQPEVSVDKLESEVTVTLVGTWD